MKKTLAFFTPDTLMNNTQKAMCYKVPLLSWHARGRDYPVTQSIHIQDSILLRENECQDLIYKGSKLG